MLHVYFTNKFKKDYKRVAKRKTNIVDFEYVVNELRNERKLKEKYKDHELHGIYEGFRECHLNPDWLLIYKIDKGELTLTLARTGTHSDLF